MRVVFAREAEVALEAIGDYIAIDNKPRAGSFLRELRDKAKGLAKFPRRFPLMPGQEEDGIRRRTYRGYVIIYQIEEDLINVLLVAHSSQDYVRLLCAQNDSPS